MDRHFPFIQTFSDHLIILIYRVSVGHLHSTFLPSGLAMSAGYFREFLLRGRGAKGAKYEPHRPWYGDTAQTHVTPAHPNLGLIYRADMDVAE